MNITTQYSFTTKEIRMFNILKKNDYTFNFGDHSTFSSTYAKQINEFFHYNMFEKVYDSKYRLTQKAIEILTQYIQRR